MVGYSHLEVAADEELTCHDCGVVEFLILVRGLLLLLDLWSQRSCCVLVSRGRSRKSVACDEEEGQIVT